MLVVKPKIEISPFILYNPDTKKFYLRILNKTNRRVTNIQARLTLCERIIEDDGGITIGRKSIELKRADIFTLGKRRDYGKAWGFIPAYNFSTLKGDGKKILKKFYNQENGEKRIQIKLLATDAQSSTTAAFFRAYTLKDIRYARRYKRDFCFEVIDEFVDFDLIKYLKD